MWEIVKVIFIVTVLLVCSVSSDGPYNSSKVYDIRFKDVAGKEVRIVANRSWDRSSNSVQSSSTTCKPVYVICCVMFELTYYLL